ncbi:hypothetical protein [Nostoc sp.]|uniref:hypothetical protein n=1 Tax=Nostoc sp. TaxID=1180 RepID=UPI002FF5E40C
MLCLPGSSSEQLHHAKYGCDRTRDLLVVPKSADKLKNKPRPNNTLSLKTPGFKMDAI